MPCSSPYEVIWQEAGEGLANCNPYLLARPCSELWGDRCWLGEFTVWCRRPAAVGTVGREARAAFRNSGTKN